MKFLKLLKENLFPENYTCDICGAETFGDNFCADCVKKVPFNNGETCPVCGRKTVRPEICVECKDDVPLYKQGVSALVYEDNACVLVSKFKNGNGYLKEYFADLLKEKINRLPAFDCMVYVPMLKKAERRRGYNQSRLLALALSERTKLPVIENALIKVKETGEQKSLSKKERKENIAGCFRIAKKDEVKNKNILLVDDVLTTGATANEITKVLLRAGASSVFLATVAAVEYKIIKSENASDV